ncbi:MAG: hypothetical protein KUG81_10575, partial [Gammaproteobacteria bacterium]|nr:hypothetical protein [Gammaproteobacteria bacterium]
QMHQRKVENQHSGQQNQCINTAGQKITKNVQGKRPRLEGKAARTSSARRSVNSELDHSFR